jgi:hypothetical protein
MELARKCLGSRGMTVAHRQQLLAETLWAKAAKSSMRRSVVDFAARIVVVVVGDRERWRGISERGAAALVEIRHSLKPPKSPCGR